MAVITLTIPDDQHQRLLDSFAETYGYESRVSDDETKEEFCKRKLIEYLLESIDHAECGPASDLAVENRKVKIRREVTIT